MKTGLPHCLPGSLGYMTISRMKAAAGKEQHFDITAFWSLVRHDRVFCNGYDGICILSHIPSYILQKFYGKMIEIIQKITFLKTGSVF